MDNKKRLLEIASIYYQHNKNNPIAQFEWIHGLILNDQEKPGVYTLDSLEPIYWNELLEYLSKNKKINYLFEKNDKSKLIDRLKKILFYSLSKKRDLIRANIPISKNFEEMMKLKVET